MVWFAACPCTSTKFSPKVAKVDAVALTPLIVALLFPSAATVRTTMSSPSSMSASSNKISCALGIENFPLATNRSAPFRTRELSALPPKMRFNAVKIIVLPAPVSPDKTVNPFDISRVELSITPIERIVISSRKVRSLTTPALNR